MVGCWEINRVCYHHFASFLHLTLNLDSWSQAGLQGGQNSAQQNRDSVPPENWAQAMSSRPNPQLDLSASSYVFIYRYRPRG